MPYPAALKSAAMRLSNYSSTIRRVTPLGKDSGHKANDSVRSLLPSNTLCDLKSLALHFVGTTAADPASDGKGVVLFPASTTSLIDQIVVSFNGVQVSATPRQYGQLVKMLDDFTHRQREAPGEAAAMTGILLRRDGHKSVIIA